MLIKWLRRNEQNHRNVEPSKTKPGKNGKYDQTNCQVKELNWWKKIKNPTNKCPGPDSFINSVAQSCLTIYNSTDCSMPDFPGHHQLSELAQTCPSSRWCHPTILSSVTHFSSYFQSFPTLGSFQMSQLFASGGQSIGASA